MSKTQDTVRLFDESRDVKPQHYPELEEYKKAIYQSYWTADEFNFSGDVQDYKVEATDIQRSIIRKTMLAISQIEVKVKSFWGEIDKTLPHTEVSAVGATFAESEVRHMDAYKELLERLGLEDDFERLSEVPAIQGRLDYLEECMQGTDSNDKREFARSVLLFSTFVEHVSLFSQFLIMQSFDRHANMFTKISNAVSATSKEEEIHGLFGQEVVRTLRAEYPDLFDEDFDAEIQEACQAAYDAEMGILDWIFEDGELEFLPREQVDAFLKNRFNECLASVDVDTMFEPDEELLDETRWFEVQMNTTRDGDFFAKTATTYTKHTQDVSADQMF